MGWSPSSDLTAVSEDRFQNCFILRPQTEDALWTVELLHWYLKLQHNAVRCVPSALELMSIIDILYDQIVCKGQNFHVNVLCIVGHSKRRSLWMVHGISKVCTPTDWRFVLGSRTTK